MISELLAGAITSLIGAVLFITTLLDPKLTFATVLNDGTPGAGFFPMIFSAVLFVLGMVMTIKNAGEIFKKKQLYDKSDGSDAGPARTTPVSSGNIITAVSVFAAIILFTVFWKLTKQFYICLFVLTLAINLLFRRPARFTILFSVGLTAFMYLMFTVGFSIRFII